MNDEDHLVDARGLLCPWPVIRLARRARELGGSGSIRILADDPIAPSEIRQLCDERGWDFLPEVDQPGAFRIKFR